jgi:hypothetical protein
VGVAERAALFQFFSIFIPDLFDFDRFLGDTDKRIFQKPIINPLSRRGTTTGLLGLFRKEAVWPKPVIFRLAFGYFFVQYPV